MTAITIKKKLDEYLPLLTIKQQELLLEMVITILKVEPNTKRISVKQYNKELAKSEKSISKGDFISQKELEKKVKKWK
jgi:hypothetical protein